MAARLSIRPAARADVVPVRRCVDEAYRPYLTRMGRRPASMLDDYADLIGRGVATVAVRGDELAGVIVGWAEESWWYIDNVAVSPSSRGSGVGRELLDWAVEAALGLGLAEVRLYTNVAMVENLAYYRRHGFVETHRSSDDGYERVHFSRPLDRRSMSDLK